MWTFSNVWRQRHRGFFNCENIGYRSEILKEFSNIYLEEYVNVPQTIRRSLSVDRTRTKRDIRGQREVLVTTLNDSEHEGRLSLSILQEANKPQSPFL